MKTYIIDAFTEAPFGGNAAGVVLLDGGFPKEEVMQALAKELGFSETAFVWPLGGDRVRLRYFTPTDEVALCGHATVAAFHGLLQWGLIESGRSYIGETRAGELSIDAGEDGVVWMDMAPPQELGGLSEQDARALYGMFGLTPADAGALRPAIVSTGLPDILMPVKDRTLLRALAPDFAAITAFSERLNVTGVHAFTVGGGGITAHARNFAPLYGIDEEAATGTASGALAFYLYRRGLVKPGAQNRFVQGEAMGRPSEIRTLLRETGNGVVIRVGGRAAIRP